jgi:uncharacterized membrane protein
MNGIPERSFPVSAGIFLGLGLGGFFDGIVLHQLLQWHHMLSSVITPDTVANLRINVIADGFFHSATYVFTAIGVSILWRRSRVGKLCWNWKLLPGTLLLGHGIFNLVEGVIDHHLLGIHHVKETVAREYWIYWDMGFLVWGAAMVVGGWVLMKAGQRDLPDLRTATAVT